MVFLSYGNAMLIDYYKRFQAWMLAKFDSDSGYEEIMAARKKKLFAGLRGTIVEIGPGAGANLHLYPKNIHWIGIEPNRFMHSYIKKEASKLGMKNMKLMTRSAEKLPFGNNSIDAVVSTLVLCTVYNQNKALNEIHRVLKPGGRFIFVEHVAAHRKSWMRILQTIVKPAWKVIADGCHPDRETLKAIRRIKFHQVKANRFSIYNTFVSPHIAGVAIK